MPRNTREHQKLEEVKKKCGPANTLISDFSPPDLRENQFLLFEATQLVVIFFNSFRKQIQILAPPRSRVLLEQIPKNVKWLLNTIMDTGCENFEVHDLKAYIALKRKLMEVCILKVILLRAQKEVRRL